MTARTIKVRIKVEGTRGPHPRPNILPRVCALNAGEDAEVGGLAKCGEWVAPAPWAHEGGGHWGWCSFFLLPPWPLL